MRRTWVVLAILVLAVLLVVTPGLVAAKGGHGGGGQGGTSFTLRGTIIGLNPDEASIDVDVKYPTSFPDTLTVQTTDSTRFKQCDPETATSIRIDFDDLEVDWDVKITGVVDGETFVATSVIQYGP
jgi:hypothetical protein